MSLVAPDRLPGLLGHELRTPLASAMTGAMLLREMVDADDPRGAVIDGVLRDLDRMTGLVDGWLALARGKAPCQQRLQLDELLGSVARRHGAEVVACPAQTRLQGNRVLLERALDNLCENSRHAGARCIRIAAQAFAGVVEIHVEDDGRGVADADREHIFAAGWSSRGSAGLGLHAVATTAAVHRGAVRCQPLARGTRFTLTLPLDEAQVASA